MTNYYFKKISVLMDSANEQLQLVMRTTREALETLNEFVKECELALASGNENRIRELAADSELGGDTPEENVRLLIASSKDSIAIFEQKLGLLYQFADISELQ